MAEAPAVGVARRTAMAGVLAAVVLPTAACGIRLEDDAPRVPLVPTRTPVPGEVELVALTRDTAALAELAATTPGDLAADLATIHRRQHTVLRSTLLRRHVPVDELDAGADARRRRDRPAEPHGIRLGTVGVRRHHAHTVRHAGRTAGAADPRRGRRCGDRRRLRGGRDRPARDRGVAARPAVRGGQPAARSSPRRAS